MTADQINYLKEQLMKVAEDGTAGATSVFFDFDNNVAFRSSNDFLIFDDVHELIHCVAANRNTYVKDETPYCMYSSAYEQLQFTEANLTLDNLNDLVESGMLSTLLTDKQKEQMKQWALDLPCNPISRAVSSYHREPAPQVNYKPVTKVSRPDGTHNSYPVNYPGKVDPIKTTSSDKVAENLASMKEGSTTMISGSEPIETPMDVSVAGVTLLGKDLPVTNQVTVSADDVTLKGFSFSNERLAGDNKKNMVKVTADNFTMDSCEITASKDVSTRTAVMANAPAFVIKDTVFGDCNGKVYNAIESLHGTTITDKVRFENCVFEENSATNNFISLYDFVDGAQIDIVNCTFKCGPKTNAIRFSNINNHHATVNITNCKWTSKCDGEYSGFILFQDSTGKNGENVQDMTAITVNIKNLTNLDGSKVFTERGTGIDRIWYTYNCAEDNVPNVVFA